MDKHREKVLAAMSGGVDSSVAAALLKEQGYHVTGVIMKIWDGKGSVPNSRRHGCYGPEEEEDIADAHRVAQILGIPLRVIDLTREYKSTVLDYFCQEYCSGRTPNPCARCNQRIKFDSLVQKAGSSGLQFDYIASGHYARIEYEPESGRYLLKKAADLSKDQSYFLSLLSQGQLSRLIFPLGNYTKDEVRKIAAGCGLEVAEKPDSQNFIAGDYTSVIEVPAAPGPVLDKDGNVLGSHRGIHSYTIGQRKGLNLSTGSSLYITAIDPERNAVIVGSRDEVYCSECTVSDLNWIAVGGINQPLTLEVKIRSSHREARADVIPLENGRVRAKFREPQMAVTPGQVSVFYHGDTVVGAGIIN